MNCTDFETLINDLARSQVIDAAKREAALSHAKACRQCDGRLAVEKQLTVGLRALAILDENKKASANTEANLLSAFRKHAEVARQPIASPAALSFTSSSRSRINRWWVAAAAVILVLLALVALRIQNTNKEVKAPEHQAVQKNSQQPEQAPNNQENDPRNSPDQRVAPSNPEGRMIGSGDNKKKATPRRPSVKDPENLNPRHAANARTQDAPTTQQPLTQAEIATPYISLMQGYMLPMTEGGQVVRVELPRSALASFGLPVNAARINERVKADVVVGHDGIARAIRFVR